MIRLPGKAGSFAPFQTLAWVKDGRSRVSRASVWYLPSNGTGPDKVSVISGSRIGQFGTGRLTSTC
ncbi:hypothetical protein BMETH_396_5 [methanotrophic bacterial endosymbiont of Bathymodiolus sp.]|nr:hypothetical protein BMETH_396_5 [methanotrophic bacterial endosymbiont of Bathymodiolus sp.]